MTLAQDAEKSVGGRSAGISFKLVGSDQLDETIEKYIGRIKDIRPVGDALISHFRQLMQKQFDTEGSYLGKSWAQLMPSTIADKTRRGTIGNGILRDSMALYYSLTGGGPGSIEIITEKSVTFGSDIYYLGYLDLGTRKMVARPVYGDKEMFLLDMEREFSSLISDHIMGRPVKASGAMSGEGGGVAKRAETRGRHEESLLDKSLELIRETIKRGREKGETWADQWSSTSGQSGGGGGGGGSGPGLGM